MAATLLFPAATLPLYAAAHHAAAAHGKPAAHPVATKHTTATAHAVPVKTRAVASRKGSRTVEVSRAEAAQAALAAKAAKAVAARHEETRLVKGHATPHKAAPAIHTAAANQPQIETAAQPREGVADHATEDRVHAWYRAQHAATASLDNSGQDASAAAANDAAADDATTPAARPVKTVARQAPQPDLSPVPHKATVADFDRALQAQTRTLHAAAESQSRTTTADDDAAVAESQIPSTAPTARVAAPFTHGDLLESAAASAGTSGTSADFTQPAKPATQDNVTSRRTDPRTDADALAKAPSNVTISPSQVRSIAAQTAASPTPKIDLQKPAPIVRSQAPVTTAVAAAARKPKLDPEVVNGMTDETFEDDNTPTQSAKAAVVLASKTSKADPVAKPPIAKLAVEDTDDESAGTPSAVKVNLYDGRGRMILIPPMKGTHEILVHQNQMAVADGLDRIDDDDQLLDMRRLKLLVALPDNDSIQVDDRLPSNRRYARPWSVRFLNDLGRAHYTRFHTPLIITSAVRTVAFQRRLILTNGNAAPPTGEVASPHLYGQAVDIGKHGMSVTEIAWMRAYLTPVESEGKIDVEEEFQQSCFHVSIYRRYLGLPARKNAPRPEAPAARPLLQVKAAPAPAKHRRIPTAILATGLRYR